MPIRLAAAICIDCACLMTTSCRKQIFVIIAINVINAITVTDGVRSLRSVLPTKNDIM